MACNNQLKLSDKIKMVHSNLRKEARAIGAERAWKKHLENETVLKEYAQSMKQLAQQYWQKNNHKNCRINWTFSHCQQYFVLGGKEYQRFREHRINNKMQAIAEGDVKQDKVTPTNDKITLLDVGSCFNPFNVYDMFEVLAIDLYPAERQVKQCDFLQVPIVNTQTIVENDQIKSLKRESFHVIVFSLLLEYIPTSEQRLVCVQKAYELLKPEGILIVITPDSSHVGANAQLIKSWRYAFALHGFMRIKYDKLTHVHCISFRKNIHRQVAERWAQLHPHFDGTISIPQDFSKK